MLLSEREDFKTRLFSVGADQVEIGRLQARQLAAILPGAKGDVLYVQGRENSFGTKCRLKGLLEELPKTPDIKLDGFRVFGDWTGASVRPAVESWITMGGKLSWIHAAAAQCDAMAFALVDLLREQGIDLPVIGVDGLEAGRKAVDRGTLAATVIQPLGIAHAMSIYRGLITGTVKPDAIPDNGNIVLPPESYPPLTTLEAKAPRH
jgi:ABC-type sugar transport system substrate-binding protein